MNSPASEAARVAEETLRQIALPRLESLEPEQISAAAAALALAAAKARAAAAAVAQIRAAQMEKEKRLQAVLDALTQVDGVMSAWCVNYAVNLTGTVGTLEVPGYLGGGVNIGFNGGGGGGGRLRLSEAMTDAGVFYNCAMEPGHLKWRPLWRYGVITAKTEDICNLTLEETEARTAHGESTMMVDEVLDLENVPIQYPPCDGEVFEVGDAVVVVFIGLDRESPVVVGFKSHPKKCLYKKAWRELR